MARKRVPPSVSVPTDAAQQLLELYYPIHYQAGIGVEDALRGSDLSRHQVAILWLVHSQGDDGARMNRKAIVLALENWFEISNAAITKAIRAMARPPLELVALREDPHSGREQVVTLTPRGERHLSAMIERGTEYVQTIIDQMDSRQIVEGISFFEKIRDVVRSRLPALQRRSARSEVDPAGHSALRRGRKTSRPARGKRRRGFFPAP